MKKSNKNGFTIVELVIVIAVIAILAAVLIPTFSNVINKANDSKALQAARNAYTQALAEALADGEITAGENYTFDGVTVTFATAGSQEPTITGIAGYTVSYANGAISVAAE